MHEWDELRFFLAVARTGSVTAAAAKLGVNQSTVSRRINHFEKSMNVRLFERLSTGYVPTPEGEELKRRASLIEEEIQAIDRHIMGKNVKLSGPIRVTTSLAIARYLLMPIFKQFNQLHPGIELHLDLSNNIYNLTQREADVAIRVTRDAIPENLIGRELGVINFGVYGEKKYVESYSRTKRKKLLRWIGENNSDSRPSWLPNEIDSLELVLRTNEVLSTLDAIQLGLGVGRLPTFIGESEYSLKKLKLQNKIPSIPVWLLSHVDMRQVTRVSLFISYLAEALRMKLKNVN